MTIDSTTGTIRVRKGTPKAECPGPEDPEAFRARLRIWGFALALVKLRCPAVAWLGNWTPLTADAHADY
eukprot:8797034-Lingulodinium_polyedra.AAC.1